MQHPPHSAHKQAPSQAPLQALQQELPQAQARARARALVGELEQEQVRGLESVQARELMRGLE